MSEAQPLLAICRHCYQPAVGSVRPPDDFEIFLCARHADGAVLVELPLVQHQSTRRPRRRLRHIQVA